MSRAAALFDELIVGVYDHNHPTKSIIFSVADRVEMILESLGHAPNVKVQPYGGLTVEFARKVGAQVMVRGMRVFSDFEFEFRLALANQRLASEIETVSFITREEHMFISGTTVREIASLGGDVSSMVPPNVERALYKEFNGGGNGNYQPPVPLRD